MTEPTTEEQVEQTESGTPRSDLPAPNASEADASDGGDSTEDQQEPAASEDPETFPKAYVQQLRTEAKDHRTKAKEATERADALAQRLHVALVAATGRLADPTDLPYDAEHLDDPEALTAAIEDLLARKPHLASRKPIGQIGQGETGGTGGVDLAALLRSRA